MNSETQTTNHGEKMTNVAIDFYSANLTFSALNAKLAIAMKKANVEVPVSVVLNTGYSNHTGSYSGVKIVCENFEIKKRAFDWVVKTITKLTDGREFDFGEHRIFQSDRNAGTIISVRWELAE